MTSTYKAVTSRKGEPIPKDDADKIMRSLETQGFRPRLDPKTNQILVIPPKEWVWESFDSAIAYLRLEREGEESFWNYNIMAIRWWQLLCYKTEKAQILFNQTHDAIRLAIADFVE